MYQRKRKIFYINDTDRHRIRNANLQHSPKKLRKKRNLRKKCVAWSILKTIIFIICLIIFFYQLMSFLTDYYSYPSTARFSVDIPIHFKMPCITFCNLNPLKRSKFCSEYPHLCEPPNNLTQFCLERPHMCSRNTSNLVIPKFGYFASDATDEIYFTLRRNLYDNRNLSQEAWSNWTWDIPTGYSTSNRDIITSLVLGVDGTNFPTCYSANLRLSNELPPLTWNTGDFELEYQLEQFSINVERDEAFRPWYIPEIVLAIHSPYVPVLPIKDGEALKIGYVYLVSVKLEEEHLLPYPYQTDCIDYDALWRKNNKTGPRSQEVCRQWCLWNNSTICNEFDYTAKMIPYTENMCELNSKNQLERKECLKNCKADCTKLKYRYKIIEIPVDERHNKADQSHSIFVRFYFEDPQVVIMSHTPVYGTGDLFSYIGGLMGCWLGFSVATFAGILESTFRVVTNLTSKLRRYFA